MQITQRTFFRHLLIFILLVLLLFSIKKPWQIVQWFYIHFIVLISTMIASILIGFSSISLVQKRVPLKILIQFLSSVQNEHPYIVYSKLKRKKMPRAIDLYLKWGSCSRCISWWLGGVFSFLLHFIYWKSIYPALYFGAAGASLSAAVGVLRYLMIYFRGTIVSMEKMVE